jgi:hypothetical protein
MFGVVPVAGQLGPLASPLGILGALIALAVVIVVGRIVLKIAWRLVLIAIVAVGVILLLGSFGITVL